MRYDEVYKSIFSHRVSVEHLLRFVAGMIDDGLERLAAFDPETLDLPPPLRDGLLRAESDDRASQMRVKASGPTSTIAPSAS